MPTLDPATAPGTPADMQIELTHDDPGHRQLFLILHGNTGFDDATRARRTLRRERDVVPFIDARRHSPMAFPAIRAAGLPTWTFRMLLQRLGEGRRLSETGAPRVVQLSFEMLDLLAETLIFAAQSLAIALGILSPFAPLGVIRSTIRVVRLGRLRHAAVMPEFIEQYKTR
jgi:hypothetical protein